LTIRDISDPSFRFQDRDLALSLGKTEIIKLNGLLEQNGKWSISVTLKDRYNFELLTDSNEYESDWLSTSGNNAAHVSQRLGVITDYNIKINFTDEVSF